LQNLPVVFCMDRGSLSGDDGATHHGLFDISYLRAVPNIVHMVPADEDELADMLLTAQLHPGPSAIRYPRGTGTGIAVKEQPQPLPIGRAQVIREGSQIAIFGLGGLLGMAGQLADELASRGFSAAVINPRFVKPLDTELLLRYATRASAIVTFEDHVLAGGFGSAILEALESAGVQVPVIRIGWPDNFIEHGKVDELRARYGITVQAALERLQPILRTIKPRSLKAVAAG
jgi:1-deoxy-D-xylulose-5-phosphate synthase